MHGRPPPTDRSLDAGAERRVVARFLASRDEASFRRLYRHHASSLYRVILRSLRSPDLAEEVLQETWVRAVSGLDRFRWESSLRTWLTGIAIRCCHEARRELAARADRVADSAAVADAPVAGRKPAGLRLELERALAELAPRRREVVLLHDVEGFTHAEIATMLEIDEGTSKSQLFHARRQLRRRLAGGDETPHPTEVRTDVRE